MHLMCHQTIPGTPYKRGEPVTDQAAISEILANPDLSKMFSQVPDGTFGVSKPAVPTRSLPTITSESSSA